GTWFLDALALVREDTEVVFDLHREDQDRTAELLRAGTVMGAVTAEADPVQGCSSVPLGIDRYRAVASPAR
ncbi:ArgP/LysG family DNA-binding transcriptional regulator, partial [Bacillus sp. S34]|nr:ArgP/LysG family DNA-binding transcriptional regulator [Bacillus sp. S34]